MTESIGPSAARALIGPPDQPELVFRRRYRTTAARLNDACRDTGRLARWFGQIEGEPQRVGDAFTARLCEAPEDVAVGRILACGPSSYTVSWQWQGEPESTVTLSVVAIDDDHAELLLQHRLRPAEASDYATGWEDLLDELTHDLEGTSRQTSSEAAVWARILRAPMELQRVLPADPATVWTAIATPDGLRRWWWTPWDDTTVTADVHECGAYRFAAPSVQIAVSGQYLAVEEPRRLAFTWVWEDEDGLSTDEAVEITLDEHPDGTLLHLRHTGPWSDDAPAQSYREGWESVLDALGRVLTR